MRKMMKNFSKAMLSAAISVSIVASSMTFAYADTFTLEQAKELALKNDEEYQNQDSYIEQAWERYNDTYKSNKNVGKSTGGVLNRFKSEISPKVNIQSAYIEMEKAEFNKSNLKRTIYNNVENAFVELIKAQHAYDDAKNNLSISEKEFNIGKIKLEQGLIVKSALSQIESSYNSYVTALDTAEKNLITAKQNLNKYLGRNLYDYNIELEASMDEINVASIDLEDIKDNMLEKKQDFYNIKKQLELTEYALDLTRTKYDKYAKQHENNKSTLFDLGEELHRAERNYNDANYAYDQALKTLDINLNATIDGMKILKNNIANLKTDIETTKEIHKQNEMKYELGLISKLEFDKSVAGLTTAENKLKDLVADLNKSYFSLTMYNTDNEEVDGEALDKAKKEVKKTLGTEVIEEKDKGRDKD